MYKWHESTHHSHTRYSKPVHVEHALIVQMFDSGKQLIYGTEIVHGA